MIDDSEDFDIDPSELLWSTGKALTDMVASTTAPGMAEWLQGDEFWQLVVQETDAEYVAASVAFETNPSTAALDRLRQAYVQVHLTWAKVRAAFDAEGERA